MKYRIMRYVGNYGINSYMQIGKITSRTKQSALVFLIKKGWSVEGLVLWED
jgi:hypothetical protein